MSNKRLKFSLVFLMVLGFTVLQAQTMYVKETDGTHTAYQLDNVDKLTFSSDDLIITKTDKSNSIYSLIDLRYLSFADYVTGISAYKVNISDFLSIYPNPVQDVLNIDLTSFSGANVRVGFFSLDGRLLQSDQLTGGGIVTMDVSHLSSGIYLCRCSSGAELKTVKIIKQ